MELSQTLCGKVLGGVARLRLYDAAKIGAVAYDSKQGSYVAVGVEDGYVPVEVAFVEGSASWRESSVAAGEVEHRVAFSLRGVRPAALSELVALSEQGVVAEVESAEGTKVLVGYSPEAGADYPLRLLAAEVATGSERGERAATEITLSSTDGWFSRRVE